MTKKNIYTLTQRNCEFNSFLIIVGKLELKNFLIYLVIHIKQHKSLPL